MVIAANSDQPEDDISANSGTESITNPAAK
jgi:hypothetical protein